MVLWTNTLCSFVDEFNFSEKSAAFMISSQPQRQ